MAVTKIIISFATINRHFLMKHRWYICNENRYYALIKKQKVFSHIYVTILPYFQILPSITLNTNNSRLDGDNCSLQYSISNHITQNTTLDIQFHKFLIPNQMQSSPRVKQGRGEQNYQRQQQECNIRNHIQSNKHKTETKFGTAGRRPGKGRR